MLNSGYARCLTVSELNLYLKEALEGDPFLNNLWVKGEISNFKIATSGHIYFTLKDEEACIKCVMFRSSAQKLLFRLANGMEVIVRGYVSIYLKDGQYQLYVQEVHTLGLGDLHLAFEQLKAKLEKEGLFDAKRKRTIPILPSKIGIVTSLTGAVLHDIISIAKRRFPGMEFIISPTSVQGAEAPQEIAAALARLNKYTDVDVIIVARGGGSLEELWAFNSELVARAIYESKIPVISAVGHETDFTIADFVADCRAPTPSAAAEMAVPSLLEIQSKLNELKNTLEQSVLNIIRTYRLKVEYLANNKIFKEPSIILNQYRQQLDNVERDFLRAVKSLMEKKHSQLDTLENKLKALSPLSILKRGYAVCRTKDGKIITDAADLKIGSIIEIKFNKGLANCQVFEIIRGVDCE